MEVTPGTTKKRTPKVRPLRRRILSESEGEQENDDNNEPEDNDNNDPDETAPGIHLRILRPKLNKELWLNFENEFLTDVKFVLKDAKEVNAHKLILVSCGSSVFRKLFCGDRFSSYEELHLPEINIDGCKEALRYIYMEDKQFKDIINVTNTYRMATVFKIKDLAIKCLEYIKHYKIKLAELFDVLHLAYLFDIKFLVYKCMKFIVENAEAVLSSDPFLEQDFDFVLKICSMQLLNIKNELHLFNTVVKWVKYQMHCSRNTVELIVDPNKFRQAMKPFLPHIRFLSMSADNFSEILDQNKELFDKTEQLHILLSITTKNRSKLPDWCNTSDKLRCTKIKNKGNITLKDIFLREEEDTYETLEINLITNNEEENNEPSSDNKKALKPEQEDIICCITIKCKSQSFNLYGLALNWKKKRNYNGPVMLTHSISVEYAKAIESKKTIAYGKLIETPRNSHHDEESTKVKFAVPILLEQGMYRLKAALTLVRGIELKTIEKGNFCNTSLEDLPFEVLSYKKYKNSFFISEVFFERNKPKLTPSTVRESRSPKRARTVGTSSLID